MNEMLSHTLEWHLQGPDSRRDNISSMCRSALAQERLAMRRTSSR